MMTKATLFAVLAPLLTLGFRALLRRLENGGHHARRSYLLVCGAVGVVALSVYAVVFRDLTLPPPSVLHGLSLLLVLVLPVGLIVTCVLEWWAMRRRPPERS